MRYAPQMSTSRSTPIAADAPAPIEAGIDAEVEIADLMVQVVRRLHRRTSEALAPLGLSRAQSRLVRLLAGGPLRMAAIAERLSVVPRTVTDLVDGVEAAGLVVRQADPGDRRSSFVALTADGRLLLDRLEVARQESAQQVVGQLDPADRNVLLHLLRDLAGEPGDAPGAGVATGPNASGTGHARIARGNAR